MGEGGGYGLIQLEPSRSPIKPIQNENFSPILS